MRAIIIILFCLFCSIAECNESGENQERINTLGLLKQSAVVFFSPLQEQSATGMTGTGFCISTSGYFLSCAHVFCDESTWKVRPNLLIFYWSGKHTYIQSTGQVVAVDSINDLAIIKNTGSPIQGIEALDMDTTESYVLGDEVSYCSCPFEMPEIGILFRHGMISGNLLLKSNITNYAIDHIELDGYTYEGTSGSPIVLNKTKKVIGILTGAYLKGNERLYSIINVVPITKAVPLLKSNLPKENYNFYTAQ